MDKELTLAEKMARKKAAMEVKSDELIENQNQFHTNDIEIKPSPKKGKGSHRNKPEPESNIVCLGRVPISPADLDEKLRKEYHIPASADEKLEKYHIQNPDDLAFLKRYARNHKDFQIYYSLMKREMKL